MHFRFRRFLTLSTYDQYNLSSKFSSIVQNMKEKLPTQYGFCCEVPSIHQLSLLFDLLEISGNIQGLLEFLGFFVEHREHLFIASQSVDGSFVRGKEPSKLLLVVSLIRKYYACVLNSSELTGKIFCG